MNDRTRALEILREAKAVLADRLTEKVLEQADEILADARGDSYMNEIESLYEQVGLKLTHVSQMLSNLPAPQPEPHSTTAAAQHAPEDAFQMATDPPGDDVFVAETLPALAGPLYIATPALPAPKTAESAKQRATTSALQAFAAQIQAGDLLAAGRTLGGLFDLEDSRAIACAATFAQRVRTEAGFFRKVMELRTEVHSNNPQRALLLLLDCFGLSRGESAEVLQTIQRRRLRHG
ncbi:MAG TPA: hypothetical protein VFV87_22455 [Pirellulaceae bacterium]|nr:hypothetical protein [Pirellulaceae bacterium]